MISTSSSKKIRVHAYMASWQGWTWTLYARNIRDARRDALTEARRMFRKLVQAGEPVDEIHYPLAVHVSVTRHD